MARTRVCSVNHAAIQENAHDVWRNSERVKSECSETDKITFTIKERERVLVPHHDALVISLTIANCLVKRILVDSGSSSNIIFQTAYQGLLPIDAEGVSLPTRLLVVDCHSSYNVILGRAWIHRMRAVPSTLHQIIKFPTPWGVRAI
ncbi:hypothetical protein BRARA_E01878 [Brassica rapa]|uniref:Aspartic peptidase DDI1-type domain-containing protein n=1 Tax=Brassica campestris TaxID=3711 RepID=A0A397ZBE7_BRACM|nr:hypothetical protein BRARA_E01878 [Brassica rapa]